MKTPVCDMNCLECKFSDCINDSDVLSSFERAVSNYIDSSISASRGLTYNLVSHKRQNKDVDQELYKQAQNRYFHKKYRSANPEYYKAKGRENYQNHQEERLATMKRYSETHKDEISAQKRTYYLEHREEILAKRKESYQPKGKRPVIDTLEAEAKRQREKERYQKNKEEINRKRRERRKLQSESCKV